MTNQKKNYAKILGNTKKSCTFASLFAEILETIPFLESRFYAIRFRGVAQSG